MLKKKFDLDLDHSISGMPWIIGLPSLVSIAPAIFLLEHRQTNKLTDATEHCPTPAAILPACNNDTVLMALMTLYGTNDTIAY